MADMTNKKDPYTWVFFRRVYMNYLIDLESYFLQELFF